MTEKILVVDNEPEMLMLMSRLIIENTSYKVIATNNPMEAVDIIRKDHVSLVISEMKMPVLDGLELLEEIKRINRDIPVIITSAYGSVEHGLEAMSKGAFNFIMKPFRKEQMFFSINKALEMARLNRENRRLREWLKLENSGNCPPDIMLAT
jgi:DNA-binding NtrC family response regulator